MTASSLARPDDVSAGSIVNRYYVAMAAPFVIDVATSAVYVWVNGQPWVFLPMALVSTVFLVLGIGIGARLLIRPVRGFLDGNRPFDQIEGPLARLPAASAMLVGCLYAPMLAARLLSPRVGITFGAAVEVSAWIDTVASFVVITAYNVILTYFIVSAYLERLCEHLFNTAGVNLGVFPRAFRTKVAMAVLFVAFAPMTLLSGDIASYDGDRLIREASMDVVSSIIGAVIIYYWITRALVGPIARLDAGMRHVADGDFSARLPVTSNDEVGRATSEFNEMVEGLAERQYLRDTFGKYVNESVADAILEDRKQGGRVADTLSEATLMFTDIQGFTTLSERLSPTEVAYILNVYYAALVPVIQRHGGVVNNCIGDGLFASFNLPLAQDNHAAAALRAALEAQQTLAGATFPAGVAIRTRIGLNTGPVIGVTIGTADWLSYTLLGDAVNIASRVEQLNKDFGSFILASESTIDAAGPGFRTTCLGPADVRGHRGDVVVYRVDGLA